MLVLFAVAGCGEQPKETPGGSAKEPVEGDRLWGHTFLLAEADTAGTALEGTDLSLRFTDKHEVQARASCNSMSGPASLGEDNRLRLDNGMSMTEMGCDDVRHDQDKWIVTFLGAEPAVTVTAERLTLTGQDGVVLELTEQSVADPDRPLVGTVWTVGSLVDGQTASSAPAGARPATMEFGDGRVDVFTGCNSGSAAYTLAGKTITVEPLVLTRKACDGGIMTVESAMVAVLTEPVSYDITSSTLALDNPSGKGLRLSAE